MPRIPVPEEYAGQSLISVAGTNDHHYGSADVNLGDRENARSLTIREGEDGWYVGTGDDVVVRGVCELFEIDAAEYVSESAADAESEPEDDEGDGSDDAMDASEEPSIAESLDAGRCPWCPEDDRYEGENVGQHASAAHPDEWTAYKED